MSLPPTPSDQNRPNDPAALDAVELASGRLDGALSPEETLRAAENPQVVAIVERLVSVREALRMPLVDEDAQRERHLAAALAAHEVGADVISLDAARERRIKRWGTIAAAAAAVAVLGAVVGTVATRGPSGTVVRSADVSVANAKVRVSDAGAAPENAAEVTAAAATAATESAAPVAADNVTIAAAESAPPARQADLVVVNDPQQLRSLAISLITDINSGARVLPQNPCPGIDGTAIATILVNRQEALLVVSPSIDSPTTLTVVVLPSCQIDTSVTG